MNTNLIKGSGVLNQTDYTSATVLSTAANFIMNRQEPFTHTFRTYIRLRENGPVQLKFWHSNAVDSTYGTKGLKLRAVSWGQLGDRIGIYRGWGH